MTNNLKQRRKELHLTQRQVAQKVGISLRGYLYYENGQREPSVTIAIRVAEALNVKTYDGLKKLFN